MPKINYILLIYRNLFLAPIHISKLLLLNSLMELLGTNTDIHILLLTDHSLHVIDFVRAPCDRQPRR